MMDLITKEAKLLYKICLKEVIHPLVDNAEFWEIQPDYAKNIVTGEFHELKPLT